MHRENEKLIRTLQECANECNHCYHACLQEADVKMLARCIQLNRQCADTCLLLATYLATGSDAQHELMTACASICEKCAEECGRHGHEHCQECARKCRECADACHHPA